MKNREMFNKLILLSLIAVLSVANVILIYYKIWKLLFIYLYFIFCLLIYLTNYNVYIFSNEQWSNKIKIIFLTKLKWLKYPKNNILNIKKIFWKNKIININSKYNNSIISLFNHLIKIIILTVNFSII